MTTRKTREKSLQHESQPFLKTIHTSNNDSIFIHRLSHLFATGGTMPPRQVLQGQLVNLDNTLPAQSVSIRIGRKVSN
jgi:hypothetical protein